MLIFLFIVAAAIFVGYAIYTQYSATPADQAVYKRVMIAVGLAVASIVSAAATYFSNLVVVP